jgi:hypothetical protein
LYIRETVWHLKCSCGRTDAEGLVKGSLGGDIAGYLHLTDAWGGAV